MTGIEFPGWRLSLIMCRPDGSDLAGWGIAAVSRDNFVRILCGPVTCDPRHPPVLGATSHSSNTAELTSFDEALRFTRSGCRFCWKEHCHGQQMQCLYFAFQGRIPHLLFTMFVVPLAMLGTNALIALPLWVLRGFVSHDNIPSLGPDSRLLLHPLFSVPHCLSRVAEVLHSLVVETQLELPSILSSVLCYAF